TPKGSPKSRVRPRPLHGSLRHQGAGDRGREAPGGVRRHRAPDQPGDAIMKDTAKIKPVDHERHAARAGMNMPSPAGKSAMRALRARVDGGGPEGSPEREAEALRYIAPLCQDGAGAVGLALSRELGRWHAGHLGNHPIRKRAIVRRTVVNESAKWRSGRA